MTTIDLQPTEPNRFRTTAPLDGDGFSIDGFTALVAPTSAPGGISYARVLFDISTERPDVALQWELSLLGEHGEQLGGGEGELRWARARRFQAGLCEISLERLDGPVAAVQVQLTPAA